MKGFSIAIVLMFYAHAVLAENCHRTPEVVQALEKAVGKPCANIESSDLEQITELDLSEMGIENLKEADFSGLIKLAELDLSHNKLNSLPENIFESNPKLVYINMHENDLKSMSDTVFNHNPALRVVDLGANVLQKLPTSLFSLNGLQNFGVDYHALADGSYKKLPSQIGQFIIQVESDVVLPVDLFGNQKNIYDLRIFGKKEGSSLAILPEKIFKGLNLAFLVIERTSIESLPDLLLSDMKYLNILYLNENKIKAFSPLFLNGLPNLVTLKVCQNQISNLPENFFSQSHLLSSFAAGGNFFSQEEMSRIENSLPNTKVSFSTADCY